MGPKHLKAHSQWRYGPSKAHVSPLSAHHLYSTDRASEGVGRQGNMEKRLSSVMMAMS
jgi:hypothetical protein